MASFTDNPNVAFNPYIQQQPLEMMAAVGMQKQQQYNQGIQRIQSEIDKVAGLSIMRDVDKNYLQTKLNETGSNIRKMVGADFSDFQLVNSVGGMINRISGDKNIQAAVQSTANVMRGNQLLAKDREEGKSSPDNEYWWEQQVGSYLNSQEVGVPFKGEYTPYWDVNSKLLEVFEKVKEIDNSIDIPYVRNANGQVVRDRNDNPVVDDALLRVKTKGKSAERILNNFYSSLDERDKKQLMITANYHYRNRSPEGLQQAVASIYGEKKRMMEQSLIDMNLELKTNKNLNSSAKAALEAQINSVSNQLESGAIEKEIEAEWGNIDPNGSNLDLKYRLYTQNYLGNLSKDLSYQSYQQELRNNPYAQAALTRERLNFERQKATQDQLNWERDHAFKWMKFQKEQDEKDPSIGKTAISAPNPTDLPAPTLADLNNQIVAILGDKETGKTGQIDLLNTKYARFITDESLKTPEAKEEYLNDLMDSYRKNPSSLEEDLNTNIKLREYIDNRRQLELDAAVLNKLYVDTMEASKEVIAQSENVYKNVSGIVDSMGNELYSAKEVGEVGWDLVKNYSTTEIPLGTSPATHTRVKAVEFLNKYKGTEQEEIAIALLKDSKQYPEGTNIMSTREKEIVKKHKEIHGDGKSPVNSANWGSLKGEAVRKVMQFQSDYLAQHMPEYRSMKFNLEVNNSQAKDRLDEKAVTAFIGHKMTEFQDYGALNTDQWKDFNLNTLKSLREDNDAIYEMYKNYDGSSELRISSGKKQVRIPANSEEFSRFFPNYARRNPTQKIQEIIRMSTNKTTNISGKDDPVNAYIHGTDLPLVAGTLFEHRVRLDVKGDVDNSGTDEDRFQVVMYVDKRNGTWTPAIPVSGSKWKNHKELAVILRDLGTGAVQEALNIYGNK